MDVLPDNIDVTGYHVSEKYDGVQGVWDGSQLLTRTGNRIAAPDWWLSGLPDRWIEGELWTGRNQFDRVRGIVCSQKAGPAWSSVKFMVFNGLAGTDHAPSVQVDQILIRSMSHFESIYQDIINNGGEGVVVTRFAPLFYLQFKRKPVSDDDGEVIGHIAGKGKYDGLCNGVIVRLRYGKVLRISAGMTDALRKSPPALGGIVRFTFRGYTSKGLPRHASLDGLRAEKSLFF